MSDLMDSNSHEFPVLDNQEHFHDKSTSPEFDSLFQGLINFDEY